jgi:hypothetical protein
MIGIETLLIKNKQQKHVALYSVVYACMYNFYRTRFLHWVAFVYFCLKSMSNKHWSMGIHVSTTEVHKSCLVQKKDLYRGIFSHVKKI